MDEGNEKERKRRSRLAGLGEYLTSSLKLPRNGGYDIPSLGSELKLQICPSLIVRVGTAYHCILRGRQSRFQPSQHTSIARHFP